MFYCLYLHIHIEFKNLTLKIYIIPLSWNLLINTHTVKHSKIYNYYILYTKTPHLPRIFDTHPLDTCSIREISQGLAPECASSTIFCRVESGNGRPLTYTPPSWLIPLWPAAEQPNRAAELWTIAAAAAVMLQWSESSEKQ